MFFALEQIPYTDEASADVCSIWHLDVDTLPEWILTSVHQVSVTRVNKDNMSTFFFFKAVDCYCWKRCKKLKKVNH